MTKVQSCQFCQRQYTGCQKEKCHSCYGLIKKYGTPKPVHFNRVCAVCNQNFYKIKTAKYCGKECAQKAIAHQKWIGYRNTYGIDLSIPKKYKAPNGSGHKEPHGYIYICKMRHPNAQKSGRIYEHTFIMSEHLGRPLIKGESVHHKNGNRADNRLENLELWSTAQPAGQRVEDKIKWAKEILELYKDFEN